MIVTRACGAYDRSRTHSAAAAAVVEGVTAINGTAAARATAAAADLRLQLLLLRWRLALSDCATA